MQHIEHQHQVALIHWARRVPLSPASDVTPGSKIADYLLAIPNGGKRSGPREGARLKAEGVKPGVSDLLLPLRRGGFGGLWLEMKAPGKKPSPDQRAWLLRMEAAGYCATWADDWQLAAEAITAYLDGSEIRKPKIEMIQRKAARCSGS
jgi:hypothetical protein